jgi:hydroxysqualene dehydroxylase
MSSPDGTTHIVGAGLAGLAAAVRLSAAGRSIVVHEASGQAGGRCRSYYDHVTGMVIDNGTHLLLSGNHSALAYLKEIGAEHMLEGSAEAEFDFVDLANLARWKIEISSGAIPWWIFDKNRRVPQTKLRDYWPLMRLLWSSGDRPLSELMPCSGPLYDRLIEPLFLAALNIEPLHGSGELAARILRETLAIGGKACRPLIAPAGIGNAFIAPALRTLRERGIEVLLQHPLHALRFEGESVSALDFGEEVVSLADDDSVILAVPPYGAISVVPDLTAPTAFRSIVNAHYRIEPPAAFTRMIGVVNGTSEWIFSLPGRIAVTVSDAGELLEMPRADLAEKIWHEVAAITGLPIELPPWQIVRERRATFAATPEENAKRPGAVTDWRNLILAGDWTATGLPATIESAVRSGHRAAELIEARRTWTRAA